MIKPHITFYDTSKAYYASYYLHGFNELKNENRLELSIAHVLPSKLKAAIQNSDWQHLLFLMILFKLQLGDKHWYFCIDTHDSNTLKISNQIDGYHLPLLQSVDAYFKVNYNPGEIERIPELNAQRDKIHSISQFIPLRPSPFLSFCRRLLFTPALFGFKPGLDFNRPYSGYLADARNRFRDLKNFQSLKQIIAYRHTPKDIDLFFRTSFRHRPSHETAMDNRLRIMQKLSDLPGLNALMGFSSYRMLPDKYANYYHPPLKQSEYIKVLARSKIVLYTPGMLGCISSKFALAMALGAAVAGNPLKNNPQWLTAYPHLREQFCHTETDQLIDYATHLATHPEKARELGALNASMFDNQLAPRPTAEYVLRTFANQLHGGKL